MALLKCPECGHEISEFANNCIYCGCPMDKIKEILNAIPDIEQQTISLDSNIVSKSRLFNSLDQNEKKLVDKITDFVLNKTLLVKTECSNNFGFKKKRKTKMLAMFKRKDGVLYFCIRTKTKLLETSKYIVNNKNLSSIKKSLLIVFTQNKD